MALDGKEYPVQTQSRKMRLIPFLASFVAVGLLFAVQQWLGARMWYPKAHVKLSLIIGAWELQYFLWGVFCWVLWRRHGDKLRRAGWRYLAFVMVPLSVLMGLAVEMTLVATFPQLTRSHELRTYWQRLDYSLTEEFLENIAIFWAAYAILRGTGHYRELRQRERAMSELAVELAEARMLALRMQINPHFLFNTMNSISSLMYSDVHAADRMMEQLSNMLRVSLARGSKQMITLREEMEFIEMYLTLQDIRSSGRVRQEIDIEPRLHDALVPAMLLQPIVENAYVHGLSKIEGEGLIEITTKADAKEIQIFVRNSGVGLDAAEREEKLGAGIGLSNVRSRLKLHFGDEARLEIRELANYVVEVSLKFPLSFAAPSELASLPGEDSKVLYEPQQEAEPEPLRRAEAS